MNETTYAAPLVVDRIQQRSLIAGIAGAVLCAIGAFDSPTQFFHSYLMGYVFWLGIVLGSMAIMMLHHMTGGGWGLVIRRLLESATRTLPLMALLFIPLLFGLHRLYAWARPEELAANELLQHKALYLNVPFFIVRAVIYFAIWALLIYFLNKWSREQDRTGNPKLVRRMQVLSGPGLVLYGLTVSFAAVDWLLSLDPEWFSTMYGLLIIAGQGLSALAFVIAVAMILSKREPMSEVLAPTHFHDLGKLMLAFVMIWAYFAFSQFLIIWAGNLPEEIPWYVRRLQGGWQWVGILLILFHFGLPFLLLLSRDLKRHARKLAILASFVILIRFVDVFWLAAPEFSQDGFHLHWMDIAAPIGVGGLWLAFFSWQLKQRPLLPIKAPDLDAALEHTHN